MRRKLFVLGVALGLCLVSCGRSEQSRSKITKETPQSNTNQKVLDNTVNTNQRTAMSAPDYPEYEDAESLVKASDAVFSGIVLGITNENDAEKLPYTIYEVKIDTLYQGKVEEDVIKIKHLNTGTKGDALRIEEGVRYLFLVELYEDSYPSLVNTRQSFFQMDSEGTKGIGEESTNKETGGQKISIDDVLAVVSDN